MSIINFPGGYRTTRTDAGSGPGSRGGHVIGRTSSGKPIYSHSTGPHAHMGFSSKDHDEAAAVHAKEAKKHKKSKGREFGMRDHHEVESSAHHEAARLKRKFKE